MDSLTVTCLKGTSDYEYGNGSHCYITHFFVPSHQGKFLISFGKGDEF